MDLVLEVAHSFSHSSDYLKGTMTVHSHKIGDKIVVHHDHFVLKKIEKVVDQVSDRNSEDHLQTVQLLTFDQLKLIIPTDIIRKSEFGLTANDYYYQLRLDHLYDTLPTQPPQIYIA